MELDKFITESINAIVTGVKNSQEFAHENGARVNPQIQQHEHDKFSTVYFGREEGARAITTIDFDISVITDIERESGMGGGIQVMSLNIGGKFGDKDKDTKTSRIKFSVNVALPNVKP